MPYFAENESSEVLLYHGGDLKANEFADGIKFHVGTDELAGPAFFTTHNLYLALYYGGKGMRSWADPSNFSDREFYRMAMEIKVQNPQACEGIVPDWKLLALSA